jgi:alkylation response protein AidB-like acyl-CoA dehydrogenase
MTEPDHPGSNPVWMGTTARLDGDSWVIDGRKWFTSGAEGSAFAIVMAVTDPDAARPHERASMIVVPTGTPGYRIVRNLPVMGEAGSDWASHAEVAFEGCRVPAANLLGPRGAGFRIAQERLGPGRIHHCMRWIGVCERVFDLMAQRLATRELSPGEVLGTKQFLQGYLAESRAEITAARLFVLDTAYKIDAVGTRNAAVELGGIKFFVAGVLDRVLDRAIQVYGGAGMLDDLPIAWWYRHERAARIYDGADEVHKANVARLILKGYGAEVR